MLRLSLFFLSIIYYLEAKCQHLEIFDHINNSNISYGVWIVGPQYKNGKMMGALYQVRVDKQTGDSALIANMKSNEWISALKNPETDWAANLLLYELYRKRGFILSGMKPDIWREKFKNEDLEFWTNFFKNNK
ncbi:hypothetical protein SIO70_25395 [Chitinophaga sancti]|uniref:hypothetical protein n=1 Tax=Chitinophaga sancti TaxID=1004 RepID=UPI002A75CD85|nr:hypothetical protein [Chitinophaga sancti]WPQ61700.1 hypothetical protein SIO70_25395 [Chitinophaga sancti]